MAEAADVRITALLSRVQAGDATAAEQLLPLLYAHLHERAAALMRREARAVTLQPTALVHEAWLRLQQSPGAAWTDRSHFLRLAARVMRNVLIDGARRRRAAGAADDAGSAALTVAAADAAEPIDVIDLHAALARLGERDPELERLVELRFFGGLTLQETAAALDKSLTATHRAWELARAFLARELRPREP
jgi:RNA polymerase sigma factor (TIGR02999 family)